MVSLEDVSYLEVQEDLGCLYGRIHSALPKPVCLPLQGCICCPYESNASTLTPADIIRVVPHTF